MAVLLTPDKRIIVQGITGSVGSAQARWALECGTKVVAGTSPGKGGQTVEGLPVYNTVKEAVDRHQANASVIFVPAAFAPAAAHEALDAGLKLVVIITENIPVKDTLAIQAHAAETGADVVGPNCPGLLTPGVGKMGIIPHNITRKGRVGLVSRSGTLAFEACADLTAAGFGQSTVIGIGGDPVPSMPFVKALQLFEADPETDYAVLVGEIGGSAEEEAAEYIRQMHKPVFAYITGRSAPPGKKMGHAGAIIRGSAGTAQGKIAALEAAGVRVADTPAGVPQLIKEYAAQTAAS
ncbi:MAG TPA: succinate--CoA ligase subunit alpha [Bacillota bacterium]|jgi:succinyl-CoA synthetase alpha subunit